MSDQPNGIEPALTKEQWAARCAAGGAEGWQVAVEAGDRELSFRWVYDKSGGDSIGIESDLLPAAMALCNAALPDDDPRKLVRADVEWIQKQGERWLAEAAEWNEERGEHQYANIAGACLLRIAAKLNALLPPEEAG